MIGTGTRRMTRADPTHNFLKSKSTRQATPCYKIKTWTPCKLFGTSPLKYFSHHKNVLLAPKLKPVLHFQAQRPEEALQLKCKVEWHGTRCGRAQGHRHEHFFEVQGKRLRKTGQQVVQSSRARKVCNTDPKTTFHEYNYAKLYCIKRKIESGVTLTPYVCHCGKFHLTSRYGKLEERA